MKALAKALDASSCAAASRGAEDSAAPRPEARPRCPPPAAPPARPRSGRSPSRRAKAISPAKSFSQGEVRNRRRRTFALPGSVPPLPGATQMRPTRGDCASFQARACSRPPLPMIRTFTGDMSYPQTCSKASFSCDLAHPALVQPDGVPAGEAGAAVARRLVAGIRRRRASCPRARGRPGCRRRSASRISSTVRRWAISSS